MFEVGVLIFSPIISINLQRLGKKNFTLIGALLMSLGSFGFGLLVYIKNDMTFFIASIFFRAMMGVGDASVGTAIFSIIGTEFKEDRDLYIGYMEGAVGCGIMIGPAIGQILYNFIGF